MNATSSLQVPALSSCPIDLTNDQISQFRQDGYLAFADVLSPSEVSDAREALANLARDLASNPSTKYTPPADRGDTRSGASYARPDSSCFMQLEGSTDPAGLSPGEIELHVRKYWNFGGEAEVFQHILAPGGRLRGVVDSLIGGDPVLFQEMALVKPPFIGSEKPWHQDNAYFSVEPLDAILGVWIALDDAGVENGCMHVIPGGHHDGAFRHHHGTDCEIDPALLDVARAVPVPIPAGGALFFYGMLPHETPPNRSPERRRALQFHYRAAHSRIIDHEAYDRIFINREGQPASCRAASRRGF